MNKFLLVAALATACSSPGPAALGKAPSNVKHPHLVSKSERLTEKAQDGFNRGDPNDPYWEPCLSYQRSWGPGACGGD
jgi:hypothetical protein